MYRITKYTSLKAKRLGLEVKPSTNKGKKIDVFKKGEKIASVGAIGYMDYPTMMILENQGKYPKGYAKMRRKLYKKRHEKDRHKKGTNGWLADQLLW